MSKQRYYLVGQPEEMWMLFRDYAGRDERTLADGTVVFEVELTDKEMGALPDTVKVMTHKEIIEHIENLPAKEERQEEKPKFKRRKME